MALKLRVEPATIVVTATGTIANATGAAQFQAFVEGQSGPVAASWSLDNAAVGLINTNGAFAAAPTAGKSLVRARVGNFEGTAEVTVKLQIEEDFANVSAADKAKLRAGGSHDTNYRFLYPYDKTVFPRGLRPPTLQFGGSKPTVFFLKVTSELVSYEGFFAAAAGPNPRLPLGDAWWSTITKSAGPADPVSVEVTKLEAAGVTGPAKETWSIAQGSLKGTVFYNTYKTAAAGNGGAVLRIKPGKDAEVFIKEATNNGTTKKCVVCHSVSAQGNVLVAGVDWSDKNPVDSAAFDIGVDVSAKVRNYSNEGRKYSFGALTPNGKYMLGSGVPDAEPRIRGVEDPYGSRLVDTANGSVLNDGYFSKNTRYALTPAFSLDSKLLAFNDRSATAGHTLALLDFDPQSLSFGNYRALVTSGSKVVAWPSFAPDGKFVVFHEGDHFDTGGWTDSATLTPHYADLKWVDVATKTVASLDALNGARPASGGGTEIYLPYGEGKDAHLNYEPTMLPAPVGGYYWVVFTSRRSYGNTIYDGANSVTAGGDVAFDNSEKSTRGYRKKLWVAAIDIAGAAGTDISHPAFYLEGQELTAGNMRGFWALDQCKANSQTCETGDECCGGFCRQVTDSQGNVSKQCVPPPATCANDSEKCSSDADCCGAASGTRCISNFCALPTPK